MEISEILKQLENNTGVFPEEALKSAMDKRDEIIPHLLKILKDAKKNPKKLDGKYMAHLYAMFLLAQFREKQAYPLIIEFFSLPGEISVDLTGDVVTEDLDRILIAVSGNDINPIKKLIENPKINEWVHCAAITALCKLVIYGERTREEIMEYYKSLFKKLKRKPSEVWNSLVNCCADLHPEEVYNDIKKAYKDGLIDGFAIELDEVEEALHKNKKTALKESAEYHKSPIENAIEEMKWWACFDKNKSIFNNFPEKKFKDIPRPALPNEGRYERKDEKIGRNAPCPCNSGKKYKKCCGAGK